MSSYLQKQIIQLPYIRLAQIFLKMSIRLPISTAPIWWLAQIAYYRVMNLILVIAIWCFLYEKFSEEKHP